MRKIIHDCDCTFGMNGCDVDDGLALLYLLGDKDAEVLGVTTAYGNNTLERVYANTREFVKKIGRPELPVLKGGRKAGETDSEASLYLSKVKRIVLMGGTTQPLLFAKKEMKELNFSCDPLATYTVLTRGTDVAVITGNNCLKVLFTREEYEREFADESRDVVRFIKKETDYWFDNNMDVYGIPGYYNWDVIAAAYMMHPELFEVNKTDFCLSVEALKKGRLTTSEDSEKNCTLEIPVIGEETRFRRNIYDTWLNVRFGETKVRNESIDYYTDL